MTQEEIIKVEAMAYASLGKNHRGELLYDTKAYHSFIAGAEWQAEEKDKLIGLMGHKIKLLQNALKEIRDFNDDSEWDNPGEIAKQALTIQ